MNEMLREKVERQASELDKTRRALECRNGEVKSWKRQAERLVVENHELKELLRDMLRWMPCQRPCRRCERYRYPVGCEFELRRRELGIEME